LLTIAYNIDNFCIFSLLNKHSGQFEEVLTKQKYLWTMYLVDSFVYHLIVLVLQRLLLSIQGYLLSYVLKSEFHRI